jgi:LacI family transcriptional regulator
MVQKRKNCGVIGLASRALTEVGTSRYWAQMLKGFQDSTAGFGQELIVLDSPSNDLWKRMDGIILCENALNTRAYLYVMPLDMPCVSVLLPALNRTSVMFDEYLSGQLGAQYLYRMGHRKILYLMDVHNIVNPTGIERRYLGFRNALREFGVPLNSNLLADLQTKIPSPGQSKDDYFEQGKFVTREWFAKNYNRYKPTAVFAQNDPAAMGAIAALEELGFNVPDDISVLGHDGVEGYLYGEKPISTLETSVYELAAKSIELLLGQIAANSKGFPFDPEDLKLSVHLIEGSTTLPVVG